MVGEPCNPGTTGEADAGVGELDMVRKAPNTRVLSQFGFSSAPLLLFLIEAIRFRHQSRDGRTQPWPTARSYSLGFAEKCSVALAPTHTTRN